MDIFQDDEYFRNVTEFLKIESDLTFEMKSLSYFLCVNLLPTTVLLLSQDPSITYCIQNKSIFSMNRGT